MNNQIIQEKKLTKKQLVKEILATIKMHEDVYNKLDRDQSYPFKLGYVEDNRNHLVNELKRLIQQ